jgi:glutaredoxin 3
MKNIKIYTTPTCPYCIRAKQLLKSLDIEYSEIDVANEPELRNQIIEKHQWMTVPAIFADDELLGGFDDINKLHTEGRLMEKLT